MDSLALINLPDLVYQQILKYMDLDSLKVLRVTCRTTKSWVETEDNIKRFNIHIFSSKFLHKELLKSETRWSSFSFSIENPFGQQMSALADFLQKYGADIKALYFSTSKLTTLDDYFQPVSVITILESCHNLRHLSMEDLDLLNCSNDTLQQLLKNWERLETLEVRGFKYLKCSSKQSGFFKNFFSNCSHLKTLQLPRTMYGEGETDEHHDRFVIQPTIDYLETSATSLKYINIHRNDSRNDDKPTLRKLIRICFQKNITVLGISSTMEEMLSNLEGKPCVSKVVGTLSLFNDGMILMNFSNLKDLKLDRSKVVVLNDNYELPHFPKLSSIQLVFRENPWESDPKSFKMFVKKIMERRRDSVTHFSARVLSLDTHIDLLLSKASDFVNNFRNLTELSLEGWTAGDDEFLILWNGLSNLETLFLLKCINLTDRGFLGDNVKHPTVLNLKKLRQLYLSEIPRLTDRFYRLAVCRMKLKYFCSSGIKRPTFQSLVKGPFVKSIQYFQTKPMDFEDGLLWKVNENQYPDISVENYGFGTRSSCRKYLKKFKNLREPNIYTWELKRPVRPCPPCSIS